MTLTNYRRLLPASLRLVLASTMGSRIDLACLVQMLRRYAGAGVRSDISGMSSASWQTATKG